MKMEVREMKKEIEFHQSQDTSESNDLFVPTMEGFIAETTKSFQMLEELIIKMKEKFVKILEYFGEEIGDGQPYMSTDEFFGIFSTFLQSFSVRVEPRQTKLCFLHDFFIYNYYIYFFF